MPTRRRTTSLTAELGAIGAVLLLLALASTGLTLWVTWQLDGGAAAVNEAGRLRMQTWRLASSATMPPAEQRDEYIAKFDATLALLRNGDPARPLTLPGDARTRGALSAVEAAWTDTRELWTR